MSLRNRTAVITGSSGGIGRAIAMRMLRSGFKIALNYATDDTRAAHVLAACLRISSNVILVKADVSRPDGAALLIERAISEFGSLDVLINNAACVVDRPVTEMSEGEWDRVVAVNMKGPFLCSQLAARQMLKQDDGGVILNIGSSTGMRGRVNGINTCASKAGLMVMTQCLALELGPKIRVNTIVPGLTHTDETERRFSLDDPTVRKVREEGIPMRRIGQPDDVANAVMLMLSDDARFITGQKLVIDGGQYMW